MSNTNTTTNTAQSTALNKTYYDRCLLDGARTRLVHAAYGQKRMVPRNHGKHVEFRRWDLFDASDAATPLAEGVTPGGQSLSQTTVETDIAQYGAYVEVSDVLADTGYDSVVPESAELLGEQMGTVVEWITRDAMCAGSNVQYVGGNASRLALDSTDVLTVNEIRKAVRTLKNAKARPFVIKGRKPHFICICSPEAVYDLQNDSMWKDVSVYSNAEQIYTGEMGSLFGVVFVESTEAKKYTQSVLNAVKSAVTSGSAFVLKTTPSEQEIAYLKKGGNKIKVGSTEYTLAASDSLTVSEGVYTVTVTATFTAEAGLSQNAIVYSEDAGSVDASTKKGMDVSASLVFGRDAYGVIDLEGKGAMEIIVKGHGSAGASDPLNQRCTVGAKVNGYAAVILNGLWLLRIEHAVSA